MASADDYAAWIVKNRDKQGTPEFATVAAAYREAKAGEPAPPSAPHTAPIASLQDQAQAGAAGVNRGAFANLPGLPVDTALNVWDLGKAGAGVVGGAFGMKPENLPTLTDRATIPGSSDWFANKERNLGLGKVIDPNVPDDPTSRKAYAFGQGGAAALLGGPANAARNVVAGGVSQVLPEVVAEHGGSPSMQVLSSFLPAVAPVIAAGKQAPPKPLTQRQEALQRAQAAGYGFPPSLVSDNPGVINSAVEKIGGKAATAQAFSVKNQNVTVSAVKRDLGIPEDVPLNTDTLQSVRNEAGKDYAVVKGAGVVQPGAAYDASLDAIIAPFKKSAQGFQNAAPHPVIAEIDSLRTPQFDAASGVEKISELRAEASSAYAKGDKIRGKALKSAADAIENALDAHLVSVGAPLDVLQNFRDARATIAKTYTAENALNPVSGAIDAVKLARVLTKNKPISGGMRQAAEAAALAPSAMSGKPGAPGVSNLDATTSLASLVASISHPGAAVGALWPVARSAARGLMTSAPYQKLMVRPGETDLMRRWRELLPQDNMGLLGAYAAPARQ